MPGNDTSSAGIRVEPFGRGPMGQPVSLYTLTNAQGARVGITNYGGIVVSLFVPDRAGRLADVVLGYDTLEGYIRNNSPYFGAIIGRYAGRISHARFTLNGREYVLPANDGDGHLHGGMRGFDKVVWEAAPLAGAGAAALQLRYLSRDGEEGYPGNLSATVTYSLDDRNALRIEYRAETDADTPVNLTNHSYFNLAGAADILGHELTIPAQRFAVMQPDLAPSGELRPVAGTPMDFTRPTPIGLRIGADDEQIRAGRGYDHTWAMDAGGGQLALAAVAHDPSSGRTLSVYTTQPGVHLYTGNFLDGSIRGKGGRVYGPRAGFCLETQHFPNSVNRPMFPSTVLRPGETCAETTIFEFSAE